jgi:hypothetical protein
MNKNKWELKYHEGRAIADIGDYDDGTYELTDNNGISIYTKSEIDDDDEDDSYIKVIVKLLNQLGAKWWVDSDRPIIYYLEHQNSELIEYIEKKGMWEDYIKWTEDKSNKEHGTNR